MSPLGGPAIADDGNLGHASAHERCVGGRENGNKVRNEIVTVRLRNDAFRGVRGLQHVLNLGRVNRLRSGQDATPSGPERCPDRKQPELSRGQGRSLPGRCEIREQVRAEHSPELLGVAPSSMQSASPATVAATGVEKRLGCDDRGYRAIDGDVEVDRDSRSTSLWSISSGTRSCATKFPRIGDSEEAR